MTKALPRFPKATRRLLATDARRMSNPITERSTPQLFKLCQTIFYNASLCGIISEEHEMVKPVVIESKELCANHAARFSTRTRTQIS